MEYRTLGGTGLEVSVLGFGASPLGDVFGKTDPTELKRAVHFAFDQGINLFDVSPYYGLTLAEQRLGAALVGKRNQAVLATKCGRYGADDFDFSAARVVAGLEDSLRRLRTDYVDLLQVHDVEFGDVEQIIAETIPAMRRLQEQGKVRFLGVTGHPLKPLVGIAQALPVEVILSYCRYNLMVDDMDRVLLPVAKKYGIALLNAAPLHMGMLTEAGAPAWHPAPPAVQQAGRRVAELCRQKGVDVSALALRFCLDHAYVSSTLVGMGSADCVRRNLEQLCLATDQELVAEVRSALGEAFNLVWPSGRAENHDV